MSTVIVKKVIVMRCQSKFDKLVNGDSGSDWKHATIGFGAGDDIVQARLKSTNKDNCIYEATTLADQLDVPLEIKE